MAYSHKGKRNLLIWDGQESGITHKEYETDCPSCQSVERYSLRGVTDNLPNALSEYITNENIITNTNNGREVKQGIPAYGVNHCCQCCKCNFWIIVGMKEIQPQRYNIFYKSTVYKK